MSRNRRRHPPQRSHLPSARAHPETPSTLQPRRSLIPTILWEAGALIGLAVLILLLATTLPHGFPPRSARAFIGALILLIVITLALGLKGLESFFKWKEPPG